MCSKHGSTSSVGHPTLGQTGGPQFLGPFRRWCQENNIVHELSSPYNPKSNGKAEAGVKNIKLLLSKCSITKEDPQRALYNWRNIPRTDGYSPAQLLGNSSPNCQQHQYTMSFMTRQQPREKKTKLSEQQEDSMRSIHPSCHR